MNHPLLVPLQVQGDEQVGGTYRAPAPPQQEAAPEAGEAAAGEGAPADEEEAAQDTASFLTRLLKLAAGFVSDGAVFGLVNFYRNVIAETCPCYQSCSLSSASSQPSSACDPHRRQVAAAVQWLRTLFKGQR